jgi:diguanylate cyclase (GGDEF)-like protein/PAS domain S-box-containing protein
LWQTIISGKEWHGEFHNRRKDGSLFWELASISPIFDDQGNITHFVAVKEDISERKQVEAALRDSEERYRVISELIFDYAYSFDVWPNDTTTCDWVTDAFRRITGYDLDELDPVNGWAQLIHPDDIPAASARSARLLQNEADVSEFRIITKSGEVRWLRDYARPVWDELQQRVVHIYGAAQDISEHKQMETSLHRHIRELEMLRITMNEISSDLNLDTLLRSILQRAVDLLEATDGEISLYDETTHDLLVLMCYNMGRDYSGIRLALNEGATGRVAATRAPLIIDNYLTWEGKLPIYEVLGAKSVVLVPLLAGEQLFGVIGIGHVYAAHERHFNDEDVRLLSLFAQQATIAIQNAHLFAEIQQLAMIDPLTGLYNRRHFFSLAADEFRHTQRYASALSVIMLDVDYFKQVNDTYGHGVGDQVLQAVTKRCQSALRNRDLIGRYGGEEIVMLLPETDLEGARQVAERLHRILSDTPTDTSVGKITITASMGVATYRKEYHASLEQLIDYADQGLYAAKQAGRNRVIVWDRALPND